MSANIIVIPGEHIGPEVTREGLKVLDWIIANRGFDCVYREELFGIKSLEVHGKLLRDGLVEECMNADAVLFGAMGGPEYDALPPEVRRQGSLLRIRKELEVFANLRPIRGHPSLADFTPLKPEVANGVDMIVLRELNGGIYFGEHGTETVDGNVERAYDTEVYTTPEIERIVRFGFELARGRRNKLCSVDKSNVLDSGRLWRKVATRVHEEEYSDVELTHLIIDNCAMQIIKNPGQFDVLVMSNMFGDILSDCAGSISGTLGMLPSAALSAEDENGRRRALYEPIHGCAPDIAGQGIANPCGSILSVAMMLDHTFKRPDDAALIETAVEEVLASGIRTPDIAPAGTTPIGTVEMGDAVISALDRLN